MKNLVSENSLINLFWEQVIINPNKIAIKCGDKQLNYRQLDEISNRLANLLISKGIARGKVVGVCLNRSVDMIVSIIAVFKSTGIYLPLTPDYPKGRCQYILKEAKVNHIICSEDLAESFKKFNKIVIKVSESKTYSSKFIKKQNYYNDVAYIMYTSGSTGQPKGIMVQHDSLIFKLTCLKDTVLHKGITQIIAKTAITFDPSIREIFLGLISGIMIRLVTEIENKSFNNLIRYCCIGMKNLIIFVPSQLKIFIKELEALSIHQLKKINTINFFICGEELKKELVNNLYNFLPKICVSNQYGPTECCMYSTEFFLNNKINGNGTVPVGIPVSLHKLYLLDKNMESISKGVIGEIYIGGVGLARGYLNRPDLTAEKFGPNPFAGKNPNTNELRLYRTGDLARYLPDGNIEFIGRIDDQVKIRGFRIELGEIESVLTNHKDIEHTIVNVQEGENGKYLIAYIIPKDLNSYNIEHSIVADSGNTYNVLSSERLRSDVDTLKAYLSSKLAEYMIPSYYVYIDSIPLTKNGKVDKKRLPLPDLSNRMIGDEYVAPRNDTEKQLAAIWSEVLKLKKIGIHDNFFKIGGHSLLVIQIVSRVKSLFHKNFNIREFFEASTIKEQVKIIDGNQLDGNNVIITKHDRAGKIPLSFAQQRLWFLDQLVTNKSLYNAPIVLSLEGDLNVKYLIKAINKLICRHESLRTIIESDNGEAYQVILPEVVINEQSCVIDVSNKDQSYIRKLVQEESCNPFDLITGPLIRVKLLKVNDSNYILIINMHHIVSDGWSNKIISSEISKYYNAYLNHTTVGLQELAIQYADYSIWQRDYLTGDVLEKQLAYWKEALSDIPDSINLPFDMKRPKNLTYKGSIYWYKLPTHIENKLNDIAQDNGTTVFTILLSALYVLLYKYTDQEDIIVGTPVANRNYKETEELVGFFVNTLALRLSINERENFLEIIKKVKNITYSAYNNQNIHFNQVVEQLSNSSSTNKNPVFQIEFSYEIFLKNELLKLKGVNSSFYELNNCFARFDMRLLAIKLPKALWLKFEYSNDLFLKNTIEIFAKAFESIISQLVKNLLKPIRSFNLITQTERKFLIKGKNSNVKDIIERFKNSVKDNQKKSALVYENKSITYQDLHLTSNKLSNYMHSLGIGEGTGVAVILNRSIDAVLAFISLLKIGAIYIPIDPNNPKERINYLIRDSNASAIITTSDILGKIPSIFMLQICLDEKKIDIYNQSSNDIDYISVPENITYIIYTSGSTGHPKGVMVTYLGLCNLITDLDKLLIFKKGEKFLHNVTFGFDPSIWLMLNPLLNGSQLIITEHVIKNSIGNVVDIIIKNKIRILHINPSIFNLLIENKKFLSYKNLKYLVGGGESWSQGNVKKFLGTSGRVFINFYGPTESTIHSLFFCVISIKNRKYNSIPIGRPINNTSIYILDRLGMLLPVGVIGEIYIGGVGLARGYLNRPDLTAEKFVPNPFAGKNPNTNELRLYRTGDLARYLLDGNIEFIGRIDDQVKIRGFRIELGEIESVLTNHKDIEHTIVNVQEGENGKYLIAYIIPKDLNSYNIEHSIVADSGNTYNVLSSERLRSDVDTLKAYLSSKLPEYMIPSYYVYIDNIPLTKNGKVDKKSLPLPDLSNRMIGDEYVAPRNDTEKQLAAIWSEVLKIKKIGIHDNFFKIGGHSLLAIQIVSRIREEFACDIQLRSIFEYSTIAELVNRISNSNYSNRPSITKYERDGYIYTKMITNAD